MLKIALALSAVILSANQATAQLAVDKLEIYANASTTAQTEVFSVTNEGKDVLQVTLSVQDWDRTETGNNQFYPQGTRPGSCGQAVSAFPAQLLLAPGEMQQVRVNIQNPPVNKACWSIIFAQTVPAKSANQGRSITYVLRTGVKLYLHPATAQIEGAIDSMAVAPTPVNDTVSTTEKSLLVRFANTGGRHMQTQGKIELRDAAGALVKSVVVEEFPTLPGSKRLLMIPLGALPKGQYTALAILDFQGPDTIAGQYQFQIL